MAQDQTDSLGARIVKLFSPDYDLTGKKKADGDEQVDTGAGRKYMEAADANERKYLATKVGKKPAAKTGPRKGVLADKRTPRKRD